MYLLRALVLMLLLFDMQCIQCEGNEGKLALMRMRKPLSYPVDFMEVVVNYSVNAN
jgi:hypothetical protein